MITRLDVCLYDVRKGSNFIHLLSTKCSHVRSQSWPLGQPLQKLIFVFLVASLLLILISVLFDVVNTAFQHHYPTIFPKSEQRKSMWRNSQNLIYYLCTLSPFQFLSPPTFSLCFPFLPLLHFLCLSLSPSPSSA